MSKSVFKKQNYYRGEWRDWSVIDSPKPAIVLPPPNSSIYSGLQGFLTFDNKHLWTVKKTVNLIGDIAIQNNQAHETLIKLLDNKELTRNMLLDSKMRYLFLDVLVAHMFNTTTLFNYNSSKILYENIRERTVSIGECFSQLLRKVLKTSFSLNDTTFVSDYRMFKDFSLEEVTSIDVNNFEFTYSDTFEQPLIKVNEKKKHSTVTYNYAPLDWICGDYNNDTLLYLEHTYLSTEGEELVSECGHYKTYTESQDYLVSLTPSIEIFIDFIYKEEMNLTSDDIDNYCDIMLSLLYNTALVFARFTLNLPSILAYDNR